MARVTVADVLADGLRRAGTTRVFTTRAAPSPLAQAAGARALAVVEARTTLGACVMASVTADLTGAPGAVLLSAGAATAEVLTGAAHAARERAPVVMVSPSRADDALLAPVVKASLPLAAASAGHWIAHAARLAMAHPRGVVHLALDPEVAMRPAVPVAASCRPDAMPAPPAHALDTAARALAGAARPLVIAGLHCGADEAKWLRAFAESLPAAVLVTLKGKGAVPDPHPLCHGLLAGDAPVLARADLLVAVGVDPSEVPPGAWPGELPVLRLGPSGLDDVTGEVALILEELAPRLRERARADWDVAELDRLRRARAPVFTGARRIVALAREATAAGVIATGDVTHAAAWQSVAPREWLSPLGQVTPGFALPAALAAALVHSRRPVLAFAAAADFGATADELHTVGALGAAVIATVFGAGDELVARAREAGVSARAVTGEDGVHAALEAALASRGPAVIAVDGLRR